MKLFNATSVVLENGLPHGADENRQSVVSVCMAKSAVPGGVLSGTGLSLARLIAAISVSGCGCYSERACDDAGQLGSGTEGLLASLIEVCANCRCR